MPSAPQTRQTRAAMPDTRAMAICQLKPIGAKNGFERVAQHAGQAVLDGGTRGPSGGDG